MDKCSSCRNICDDSGFSNVNPGSISNNSCICCRKRNNRNYRMWFQNIKFITMGKILKDNRAGCCFTSHSSFSSRVCPSKDKFHDEADGSQNGTLESRWVQSSAIVITDLGDDLG
ncbi:hypothetical protein WN51_12338 [Melipona quadrifasciata]|uniref:Uncharacterized protein n=1 Tax=Melipona quadrifasciata TaxID=166423 RepID=A0A0N1ITQ5_9HYME|nr:hypothetical protein WN51_12338 [Melipona quadrifasciata]